MTPNFDLVPVQEKDYVLIQNLIRFTDLRPLS